MGRACRKPPGGVVLPAPPAVRRYGEALEDITDDFRLDGLRPDNVMRVRPYAGYK